MSVAETKQCARCRSSFEKLSNVSRSEWKKRQYCSPKCAADARWAAIRAAKKAKSMAELESRGVDVPIFLARVADVVQRGFVIATAKEKEGQ